MTLAEHHARLKAEGKWNEYVARKKERDEEIERNAQEHARAEALVVNELRKADVPVESVWDLVNATNTYAQSLPILLDHLKRPYPDVVREGIARAMAVPGARFAWPVLVTLYRQEPGRRTKAGLAVALANVADDETIDDLIALARDAQHGESRLLLLNALERSRLPQARKALMELGGDSGLQKEVQRILRRLKQTRK
jgi:hypothetical protein